MFNILHPCFASASWRVMAAPAMPLLPEPARADIVVIGSDAGEVRTGAVLDALRDPSFDLASLPR
jgi:hypothetical protein